MSDKTQRAPIIDRLLKDARKKLERAKHFLEKARAPDCENPRPLYIRAKQWAEKGHKDVAEAEMIAGL